MIWVRGRIVPDDALRVSVLDRTFEHGLGLFETLRTWAGRPTLLPRHLERLTRSAGELGLFIDPNDLPDEQAVRELMQAEGLEGDALLRMTLSGGLSPTDGSTLWMRSHPLPPPVGEAGATLGPTGRARSDPLVTHKTLNYWPYRLLYERARAGGFDECLTLGEDGTLWEGSRTNLFVVIDDELVTPPCSGRILPGIMRGLVIERASALGVGVQEAALCVFDRLFRPEEIFLTNSVRGILPVGRWGGATYPVPGPVTRSIRDDLQAWLDSGGTT